MLEITMRTKICMIQLIQLLLALDITTQDVTSGKHNSTEDGLLLQQNQDENNGNITEYYRSLEVKSEDDLWTAGRTLCRSDNKCDFHQGSAYKYCYVDYSNNWDYCCTGTCGFHGENYMWCQSGNQWQYCGDAGYIGIDKISCYYSHACGMHQETGQEEYYWCYIDHKLNWRKCCAPSSPCDYYGQSYKWCYTGNSKDSVWEYCK